MTTTTPVGSKPHIDSSEIHPLHQVFRGTVFLTVAHQTVPTFTTAAMNTAQRGHHLGFSSNVTFPKMLFPITCHSHLPTLPSLSHSTLHSQMLSSDHLYLSVGFEL